MTDIRKAVVRDLAAKAAGVTAVLALGFALAPGAQAAGAPASGAGAPAPVAAAELAQARAAAQSPAVLDKLGHFFARQGVPPTGQSAPGAAEEARAAVAAAPRLAGDTYAVYTLDRDFVAGTPGVPVAKAEFAASRAVSADGQVASVWTVREAGGWRVVNVASGGDESDYPALAASGGGGTAFREPQINAWYVLREGRVLPLDDEARRSVGAGGIELAAYQKLVHQRYGDKLPGSAYDRAGEGGGYRPDAAAPTTSGGGSTLPAAAAAAALGVTALMGAGLALRRRLHG
ncbi:hypothetical protein OG689_17380 [Kitasatospora sp. NBC_00240]|uniref:hypothetical protein n=1 Tax=Kitasatospora sp. NBC_00240 TaxID=2903567 RepID=UPI002258C7D8|nr:hypothetical protein [Kitasatospora sp. NBC_00240]MCX5211044.1 hypothetical protein [Kitasatospora sp. NBC_00240]